MQPPLRTIGAGGLLAVLAGLTVLSAVSPAQAGSYGMGPGMMGSGMMGPGRMGSPPGSAEASPATVDPARADALLAYIHEHDPACLQCHAISGASFGPSFASIATRYAGQSGVEALLAQHIADGFGRMPPGLASEAEAARLARRILELADRPPLNQAERPPR